MNIKMIVTDLDGTLLRSDETVSERTISTFKRCRDSGLKVIYATGRGASSKVVVPNDLFDGFVRCNGATAHDGDKLIHSKRLEIDSVRPLLLAADASDTNIVVECDDFHYANFDLATLWEAFEDYAKIADFSTLTGQADKLYTPAITQDAVDLLKKHMPSDTYMYLSNDGFALIMHNDATKSKAVNALANEWGIKPDEIVSFGDDTNDIDLLEYSGIGIAMGNASDIVKKSANEICDTNNNDGIAKWLEANVL